MKTDPIMEELYKIKEQIAAENDYDVTKICDSVRALEKVLAARRAKKKPRSLKTIQKKSA